MVGPDIVARYRIHQHRSDDADHVSVGEVDGVPVLLDRRYVEADRRILTGFVEPHFFAGWSGGPKGACPGLAATATILEAHSPARIADPRSTWLTIRETRSTSSSPRRPSLCPPDLSVDVTIDTRRRLTGVFAGPLPDGHRSACAYAAGTSPAPSPDRFDVVVSTNGGHPLDRNLYQSVKGLAAAERVVAEGGIIVMAAPAATECPTTAPLPASSAALRRRGAGPAAGPGAVDVWQAQVLGRVLRRAEVWLYAEGLSHDEIRTAQMVPVDDIQMALDEALAEQGPKARLCVLTQGPLTVATPAA